jgi:integrase
VAWAVWTIKPTLKRNDKGSEFFRAFFLCRSHSRVMLAKKAAEKFALAVDTLAIDCTLHALRHTHVSQLIAAGMDVLTISRRIGHANAAITLRAYGHLFNNTDSRAAEIMEATFAKVQCSWVAIGWQFPPNTSKNPVKPD